MKEVRIIGKKSMIPAFNAFVLMCLGGGVYALLVYVLHFDYVIPMYCTLAVEIILLLRMIYVFSKPNELIAYLDNSIILYPDKHNIILPIRDIKRVKCTKAKDVMLWPYGKAVFYTQNRTYKVRMVNDIKDVRLTLMDIVDKYNYYKHSI